MPRAQPQLSPFGQQLRYWRRERGMSQLELAVSAQTTPRHVSFIETGRSRPGRELILRLAECLGLGMREGNQLLTAAGLQPVFAERDLDDEELRPFRMAVEAILDRHEPYPASAMDALGRVVMANAACRRLFPEAESLSAERALDDFLGPGPNRTMIENWAEVAWATVDRMRQDAARTRDPRLTPLIERALAHLDGVSRPSSTAAPSSPVMVMRLRVGDEVLRLFTTVMRFETAQEITISELRVELVFPMDAAGEAFFRELAAG